MNPALRRTLITLAVLSGVSVAFSWPLILAPGSALVTRQVDAYGMLWLAHQALGLGWPPHSDAVAWPLGQDLGWCDSFVYLAVAGATRAGHAPLALAAAFTLLGPVFSGWAAERAAVHLLGARFPWSLVAGLGYAFSGLMATALLEGHLYALFNPWLPLLAWAWFLALGRSGRPLHGALAGVCWVLCLLTTAYAGIAAALLVAGIAAFQARPRWTRLAPLCAAAAVAIPAGIVYALALSRVREAAPTLDLPLGITDVPLWGGSANLSSLAGFYPGIDEIGHSMGPALGWTTFLLAAFAPLALGWKRRWVALLGVALAVGLLSLGPEIGPLFTRRFMWLWTPWSLIDPQILGGFRFPCRLLLVTSFGLSAVAAVVASELARTTPRLALLLLPAVLVDIFAVNRVAARTGVFTLETPAAYAALPAGGAVLEVTPPVLGGGTETDMFLRSLTALYQTRHGHPVLHPWGSDGQRVVAGYTRSPGMLVNQALDGWFFAGICPAGGWGEECDLHAWLAGIGVGAIVVRPGLWLPAERDLVLERLAAAFGEPDGNSRDAGQWVLVFRVDGAPAGRDAARSAYLAWSGA